MALAWPTHGYSKLGRRFRLKMISLTGLRRNADLSSVASLNKKLFSPRIEDVLAFIPAATFYEIYPAAEKMSITSPMFEVLLEDDRLMFPNHFKNGSASAL